MEVMENWCHFPSRLRCFKRPEKMWQSQKGQDSPYFVKWRKNYHYQELLL